MPPSWLKADLWIISQFLFWMVLVFLIGRVLARKGDLLGKVTGMGGSWVGLVFLACATSLPELITGVVSAGVVKVPDLALGNIFGSCLFNLAILSVLDFLDKKKQILRHVRSSHILPAMLGVFLIGIGVLGVWVLSPGRLPAPWRWAFSAALLAGYAVSIHLIYRQSRGEAGEGPEQVPPHVTKKRVIIEFSVWSGLLIGTAIMLSITGDRFSEHEFMGKYVLGPTFVGTFLLAAATSLPELSVSIEAARIGAMDMAVGNVLGSNIFNLAVIPICEVAAWLGGGGPVLSGADPIHMLSGGFSILLTLIVVAAIRRPPRPRVGAMGIETFLILLIYLAASVAIFFLGLK